MVQQIGEYLEVDSSSGRQVIKCRKCGHVFPPEGFYWSCPECQAFEVEITAGKELYIESIEVE